MNKTSSLKYKGEKLFTAEYIQSLRDADRKKANPKNIIAQKGAQERMLSQDVDIQICGGSRGGPLHVDTKVVTPFGLRRIGDMNVGDILTGLDGGMQRVISKIDYGKVRSYKLKFIDGSEVIASYDHPFNVRKTCYRSKKRILGGKDVSADWRVWTTEMIVRHLKAKKEGRIKNGHLVIPLCEPVKFTVAKKRHGIDPYLLGVILGDGCITENIVKHNNILFSTIDVAIINAFVDKGYEPHLRSKYKSTDYIFKSKEFVEALRKFQLAGHGAESKFVPHPFKLGTVEERWAVLQGLMDTDGTIDKRGHCSFTTISKLLAEDVKFLVNSLGGVATISKGETFYTSKGVRKQCKDAYHVYIRIQQSHRLFRLERKKSLSTEYNGGISEYTRRIVDYEDVGEQDVCCIGVSNPDSLFMVNDFIVTHNSKSFSLLMEGLKDVKNRYFNAVILRKEKNDLESIINDSYKVYSQYGTYNRSQNDMTWNFTYGGWLKFSYYADSFEDFKDRFQGRQYSFVGIDEITQCSYKKFKYLITCNRNAYHIRNRFWGTCNPDPASWVRKFIDWWIDEDGYAIPERDGVVRYCYMDGDTPDSIFWGDTPQDVYEQCKSLIDPLWREEYAALGYDRVSMFVKSATFIRADISDNVKLLESDPSYVANLAQQGEEQRMRDLMANWNRVSAGNDMITLTDMEAFYDNAEQTDDGKLYCSCDIAFSGGDSLVMWLWEGHHIKDIFVSKTDARNTLNLVKAQLLRWGVEECNFTYDLNGLGQTFRGFFPDAVPFNNMGAPIARTNAEAAGIKNIYKDLKSQCAWMLADMIKNGKISINRELLTLKFSGSGFNKWELGQILMKERKCIKRDDSSADKGFKIIPKTLMKRFVGHSPDFFESMMFRVIFDIKKQKHEKPRNLWMFS